LRPNPGAAIPVATAHHRDAAVTQHCLRHRLSCLTIDPKVLILQELPKSVMTERSPSPRKHRVCDEDEEPMIVL